MRRFLEEIGRHAWVDSAELAISEVVTNASLHAHTAVEIRLTSYVDQVCVEVRDFNTTLPVQRNYDVQATTGRGMALVAAVTLECGVHPLGESGKVVWFCVGDPPASSVDDILLEWDAEGWSEPAPASAETRRVVLASMPATLWLSARQHHDAILREFVLYRAEHGAAEIDLAAADKARSTISNALIAALEEARASGTARPVLPEGHPSPLPWVPDDLDLHIDVGADAAWNFAALQDALDVAEALALEGKLLLRPGLPEIIAVRDWACEQVIAQLSGGPPAPWPGTSHMRFETDVHAPVVVEWDSPIVTDSDRGVIAADDANRIVAVSGPLARRLGWRPEDLVGRRVVTIVPPALREAHVAGFSRHLSTGEAHVLGVPLDLPVLCK
ncbi:MAG: PAS domain S-box protein, partial [Acidimicrobiales bacterium]|nr:PAS domain S-box protein [Acidimicrobiales bacterium]